MHCCCFEWFGFFFSPLLLRVVLNWIEDFMNALSTASLWTGRQCCSEGVVRRWRLSGGGVIVMGWRGWMCGCVRFTPQRLFFFFYFFYYLFLKKFPGPQAEDAKSGAELTDSFTGSCYSFIRKRSMWERREEWAWGKIGFANLCSVAENRLEPDYH